MSALTIGQITTALEKDFPLSYQEDYDNCGLITGEKSTPITGILISLDCIESIIDEAIEKKCNLIIAHHPIVFKGLKKLNGQNYVEKTIIKAIRNDIAIYAIHTNLDNGFNGVNYKIAEKIGLENVHTLAPKSGFLKKLITYVPVNETEKVLQALFDTGAGNISNYSECSFRWEGTGTFKGNDASNPVLGEKNKREQVQENRIEVIFRKDLESKLLKALFTAHPYEEVAYDVISLDNRLQSMGSGIIGNLAKPMSGMDFLKSLKEKMSLNMIKYTPLTNKPIQKIAVCGGSGSFLLKNAISAGADVFVSADFKYHEFFDAENKIVIADIGHYESEVFTKDLIYAFLIEKFSNIAVHLSGINTNPVNYL